MGVREDIVSCAREHIGDPYNREASYPRTGPACDYDSFNCSGFTRAVYDECGLTIPSWQGAQNGEGSQSDLVRWHGHWVTDPAQLKPGDLVFFSNSGDPYNTGHVGISLGGWQMIDSVPNGGVQQRELYGSFVGGGWPLVLLPDELNLNDSEMSPVNFTYEFDKFTSIRSEPRIANDTYIDHYNAGDTVRIDGLVVGDGYIWGHYKGQSSGKDRYVAIAEINRGNVK